MGSAIVLSPPGSATAGYSANIETRACSIVIESRSAWYRPKAS